MSELLNTIFWVASNLAVLYIAVALIVFVVLYYWWFDIRATTGGRLIFHFFVSLLLLIGLVIVGTFVDASSNRNPFHFPADVAWWRPALRFVVYGYISYRITNLSVLLWFRKFRPNKMRKAKLDSAFLKLRLRHTGEIPVIQVPKLGPFKK